MPSKLLRITSWINQDKIPAQSRRPLTISDAALRPVEPVIRCDGNISAQANLQSAGRNRPSRFFIQKQL